MAALRYFPKAPDPSFEARLGREVTGFAKLIRNHPQGNPKLSHWLHRITVPTLVLWGANDRLVPPAYGEAYKRHIAHAEMKRIMSDKDMQEKLSNLGLIPLDPPSIPDTEAYIKSETAKWSEVVKQVGLAGSQ